MATKRLGRGINALIRETTDESAQTNPIFHVSLKLVSPNPHQPRQKFDEKSLKELAESIREKGIIQPITVRTRDKGYELIAGERRLRAAKLAGLTEVPVHVLEIEDDVEMMEMALIENIQRENLNVVEEAEAYAMLNNNYKLSHTAIAKAVGKSRASISNTLRLLKLPAEVIEMSVEEKSRVAGQRISETKCPPDAVFAAIIRNEQLVPAVGSAELLPGDRVIMLSKTEAVAQAETLFRVHA